MTTTKTLLEVEHPTEAVGVHETLLNTAFACGWSARILDPAQEVLDKVFSCGCGEPVRAEYVSPIKFVGDIGFYAILVALMILGLSWMIAAAI